MHFSEQIWYDLSNFYYERAYFSPIIELFGKILCLDIL